MKKIAKLVELIKHALQAIEPSYFNLKTTYEPSGIVRERVFCYELYHQMRLLMTEEHGFSLNGEIDKRGHLDFKPEHRKNPDFVFHIPGTHSGNAIVMEVKGRIDYHNRELQEDFKTLLNFVSNYHYQMGIFLLYNHSFGKLQERHGDLLKSLKSHPAANSILIITIDDPKSEPEEIFLSEI